MNIIIGIFCTLLMLAVPAFAGPTASCDDEAAWKAWDEQRAKFKGTATGNDVEYLFRLRVFICGEVATGRLTEAEGNPLFEGERRRLIDRAHRAGRDSPA